MSKEVYRFKDSGRNWWKVTRQFVEMTTDKYGDLAYDWGYEIFRDGIIIYSNIITVETDEPPTELDCLKDFIADMSSSVMDWQNGSWE